MINSVRNTVLAVLNKNNYGYISPSDFNLYAKQAQMEVFEEYFSNYNKIINMENARISGTHYADLKKNAEENMEIFSVSKFLSHSSLNKYFLPSLITTGDESILLNKVLCYYTITTSGTNDAVLADSLSCSTATFETDGVSAGDLVVNLDTEDTAHVVSVVSESELLLDADIFPSSNTEFKVYDQEGVSEAEKVNHSRITSLLMSNLTSPTMAYPAYTQEQDFIKIFPAAINKPGQVLAQYFRYPYDPKWTYSTILGGAPVFDQSQSDYQDFEVPLQTEYRLVMKILQYCGVSIREEEVAQFAAAAEQKEEPTFSQKQ
jgi:hypothetical protein